MLSHGLLIRHVPARCGWLVALTAGERHGSLGLCFHTSLVCVMRHVGVLKAPLSLCAVGQLVALGFLGLTACGVQLLRCAAAKQGHEEGGDDQYANHLTAPWALR